MATGWTSPTLRGERVLLRPLGSQDTDDLWVDVQDPEGQRLTGLHHTFTYEEIAAYCASRADKTDRITLAVADKTDRITLAVADPRDGTYKGEVVLMDHDEPNHSASLRIGLAPTARGQGLGADVLRLVLAHAFGPLGLHRVSLDSFAFSTPTGAIHRASAHG